MDEFQTPEWQDSTLNTDNNEDKEADNKELEVEEDADNKELDVEEEKKSDSEDMSSVETDDADASVCDSEGEDPVLNALSELSEKMDQMNMLFTQKIQHTTHEEKIVDQMHAELQKYKDDMYAQLVRPILLDIIEIRESIRRVSASFASKPEEERAVPLKTFSDYTFDIQDVLEKNNINIYDSKEGDDFSALKQRAIKKITTPVEELHGKIAESLSSGYEYMGKTISPEKVVVYVYQKSETTEGVN